MTKRPFFANEILSELRDVEVSAIVFSQNGVRLWAKTLVFDARTYFSVEILALDGFEAHFDTLREAMDYAEDNQRT